jgi:hypothetical protein
MTTVLQRPLLPLLPLPLRPPVRPVRRRDAVAAPRLVWLRRFLPLLQTTMTMMARMPIQMTTSIMMVAMTMTKRKKQKKREEEEGDAEDDEKAGADVDEDDDVDDKVDAPQDVAVVAPVKAVAPSWRDFVKHVGNAWTCCGQQFAEEAMARSHYVYTHEKRLCPHAKNGCPESFAGGLELQRHIRVCVFKNKRGRVSAHARPMAIASVKTQYMESVSRHSARTVFAKWLPPAAPSVYSAANAASFVDNDSGDAESLKLAVSKPLNGKKRDAAALPTFQIKRFTSVAVDDAGAVLADDSPAVVHEYVMYCGAPIWTAAWMPADIAEVVGGVARDGAQFFAIATHDVKTPLMRPRTPSDGVGRVIQIWRASTLMPLQGAPARSKPVCSVLLAHRFGAVREIKWFPLISAANAQVDSVRLGVFALVTNDGLLRIVAVPKPPAPPARSALPPVVDVPVCCTITMPAQEAALCCAWSNDADSRYLAIGGSMGSVRVYDMVAWHDAA